MALKSKAHIRKYAELLAVKKISQKQYDKAMMETPDAKKLPERISPPKPKSTNDLRNLGARFGVKK